MGFSRRGSRNVRTVGGVKFVVTTEDAPLGGKQSVTLSSVAGSVNLGPGVDKGKVLQILSIVANAIEESADA